MNTITLSEGYSIEVADNGVIRPIKTDKTIWLFEDDKRLEQVMFQEIVKMRELLQAIAVASHSTGEVHEAMDNVREYINSLPK